ncbi:MAG: hypothetical protein FWF85_01355, partial [Clostridiales bacterium]|nr:hypothetical protein [Clostridiales bacterium]
PLGYTSAYTYDIYGNKKTETKPAPGAAPTTSPAGAVYTYTYDALDRLTRMDYKPSSSGSTSKLEEYVYTVLGSGQTTVKESKYFSSSVKADTTVTYDYAGRVVKQVNPDSGVIINEYNLNGTLKQTTDPRGNLTSYQYDALNRPTKQWTSADNDIFSCVELGYDKCDRVTTRKQSTDLLYYGTIPSPASIILTTTSYNKDGTVAEQTVEQDSAQKGRTVYAYDADGNMTQEKQYTAASAFNQIDYTYNSMGQVWTKKLNVTGTDIISGDTSLTTTYTYDLQGNLKTEANPTFTTTYGYDYMNRQTSISQPGLTETGASTTISSSKTYDWAGNVLTQTDPNSKTTGYTYDARGFLTKITDPLAGVTAYEYDFAGRKTKEISPQNYATNQSNRTAFAYDGMGRLTSQTEYFDSNSTVNSFTYDLNGNMLTKKDGKNYTTTYTYTVGNQLATVKDPVAADKGLNFSFKYEYDGLGRKIKETNANGIISQYSYDALNNLLTTTVNNRLMETNTYDYLGNLLTTTDANSKTTTMTYNALNQVRRITYPGDSNIGSYYVDYKYNKLGLVAEALDSVSPYKKVVTAYNNQGQVLSQTESTGAGTQAITVSNRYDKGGNMRFTVDGCGNETEYVYDALNRKTQEKAKVSVNGSLTTQTTTYAYDANSNPTSVTDWRNNTVQNVYDPLNRLIQRKDANNTVIETLTYDANHQQITSKDGNNHTTTFVYDKNNRLVEKYNYLNEAQSGTKISEKQEYDNLGRVVSKKDGKNNTTLYSYDSWGNLAWVKDAMSKQTDFAYDYNGNLISQTDPNGNITQFTYNARNLLQIKTDALGQDELYSYNANGTISGKTDRNGTWTVYEYDIHGRLGMEFVTMPVMEIISHYYDNNGNELSMIDGPGGNHTTTRIYDELNRVVSKTVPDIGTTTFKYDETTALPNGQALPAGYRKEVTTDPKNNVTTKVTDKNGRLVQVFDGSSLVATYAYQNNGNRASVTYASGVKEEYTYNDNNLLKTLTNKNSGGSTIEAFNYGYDLAGNMTSKLDKKGTTSYTYDADNRLATVTEPGSKVTTYTFDNAGNRATESVQLGSTTTATGYSYDANNRLLGTQTSEGQSIIGSDEYTYDKNGNMLSRISFEGSPPNTTPGLSLEILGEEVGSGTSALYSYDVFNNMIEVKEGNNRIEMKYNGSGQRVEKTVNGTTTRYLYEYDQVILEVNGSNTQTGRNIYGLNLLRRKEGVTNLDYLYNGHGDVTNLMNGTTIAATYYYDAFGNVTEDTGSSTNPYRYAGYQYDKESKFYYLNARHYSCRLQKYKTGFLSPK